ncbi:MAG TPA: hypothetical protein VFE91_01360 [Nitrososphaerales archaeon]|nr:hypothetical protein [Nitrososphaerales archaeon]
MSVRVSPISRTAAIVILAIGVFTLFTGVVADIVENEIAGVAIIALGIFLYRLLYRFSDRVSKEVREAEKSS